MFSILKLPPPSCAVLLVDTINQCTEPPWTYLNMCKPILEQRNAPTFAPFLQFSSVGIQEAHVPAPRAVNLLKQILKQMVACLNWISSWLIRSDSAQNHIQIEPPIFIGFRRQLGAIHDHAFTKREALTPSKSELWKRVATPLRCFYMNSWNMFLEITLRPTMTGCILNKNKLHLPPKKWFLMFSSHCSLRKKNDFCTKGLPQPHFWTFQPIPGAAWPRHWWLGRPAVGCEMLTPLIHGKPSGLYPLVMSQLW